MSRACCSRTHCQRLSRPHPARHRVRLHEALSGPSSRALKTKESAYRCVGYYPVDIDRHRLRFRLNLQPYLLHDCRYQKSKVEPVMYCPVVRLNALTKFDAFAMYITFALPETQAIPSPAPAPPPGHPPCGHLRKLGIKGAPPPESAHTSSCL